MEMNQVPLEACRFTSEFKLSDNGEEAASAPFHMVARTGDPVETTFFGRVVHDMQGMKLKGEKVSIDYQHDPKEIIGYAYKFDNSSGDLEVYGALTPNRFNSRAQEIIELSKSGVPFESSINFGGDGIVLERVAVDETVTVNNREFSGPGTIVREWPLRNIAITPLGQDGGTSVEFNAENSIQVQYVNHKETEMSEQEKPVDVESTDEHTVEATDMSEQVVEAETVEATEEPTSEQVVETVPSEECVYAVRKEDASPYIAAFGLDRGSLYFATGLSLDEAKTKEIEVLREENTKLSAKVIKPTVEGEEEACSFSAVSTVPERTTKLGIPGAPQVSPNKDLGV